MDLLLQPEAIPILTRSNPNLSSEMPSHHHFDVTGASCVTGEPVCTGGTSAAVQGVRTVIPASDDLQFSSPMTLGREHRINFPAMTMTGTPSTFRVASSLGCCHDFDIRAGHAFRGYNRINTAAAAWSRLPGLVALFPGGRSSCQFTSSRKEREVQVSSLGTRDAAGVAINSRHLAFAPPSFPSLVV